MPRIVLDTQGGEFAPAAAVEAAARVSLENGIEVVLVGHVDQVQVLLEGHAYDPQRILVRHCAAAVGEFGEVRRVWHSRREPSVAVAAGLLARGEADALVTAGNPEATVLAVAQQLDRLPGVERLGLASVYPREIDEAGQDPFAMLVDVGAAVRCTAQDLLAFATLGAVWAQHVSGLPTPRIGLLNAGLSEDAGGEMLAAAHRLLRGRPGLGFVGNIEGSEITRGKADIVVCEGLVGNVVIKLLESIEEVAAAVGRHGGSEGWRARLGIRPLAQQIARLKEIPERPGYAGAPVLGIGLVCLQLHPRARVGAFVNAIKLAAKAVRDGVPAEMRAAMAGRAG